MDASSKTALKPEGWKIFKIPCLIFHAASAALSILHLKKRGKRKAPDFVSTEKWKRRVLKDGTHLTVISLLAAII